MVVQSSALSVIQPVKAGDLITASLINGLISALQGLEQRVADLEAEPRAGPASPPRGTGRPIRPRGEATDVLSGAQAQEMQGETSIAKGVQAGEGRG